MAKLYSAFKCPPDFDKSQLHAKAVKVQNKNKLMAPTERCLCSVCSSCDNNGEIYAQSLPICTSTRKLRFMGSEIPLMFYFIEISLVLIIISVFIGAGQYLACSLKDTCQINLSAQFTFLDYIVELPMGYTDHGDLQVMHLIILSFYTVIFTILQIWLRVKMFHQESITNANTFILLINVQKTSKKKDIKQLFQGHGYKVTQILLIKKLRPWLKQMKQKARLKRLLSKEKKGSRNTYTSLLEQQNLILTKLKHQLQDNDQEYRTSYVIVRLDSKDKRNRFLQRFQTNIITKLWYKLFTCFSPLKLVNQHISVMPAPSPKDIIWQNLQIPYIRTYLKRILFNVGSLILVVSLSMSTLYLTTQQETFVGGIMISLSIQVSNLILVQFIEWSSSHEETITHTNAKITLTLKLTFFQFLNVTFMPFLILGYNVFIEDVQSDGQKLALTKMTTSIILIYSGNLIKSLLMIFSIERFIKYMRRRIALKQGKNSLLFQYQANQLFEPPEFHIQVVYSVIISSLMGTFFYLSIIPSIIVVELLLIFLILIATRHLLFNVCKQPRQFDSLLNRSVNKISQLCIIIYWIGRIIFKIILVEPKNYLEMLEAMWNDLYFKIEVGVIGSYVIFVYLLSVDEWVGKKFGQKQRHSRKQQSRSRLMDESSEAVTHPKYQNSHSYVRYNSRVQDITYEQSKFMTVQQIYPYQQQTQINVAANPD